MDTVSSLGSGPILIYAGTFGTGVLGTNFAIGNQLELGSTITVGGQSTETASVVTLGTGTAGASVTFVGPISLTNMNYITAGSAGVVFAGVVKDANYPTVTGGLTLAAGNALILNNKLNSYSGGTILGGNQGTDADLQVETSDVADNAIEALTFTGSPTSYNTVANTGSTFTLSFGQPASVGAAVPFTFTTAAIQYSTATATLQSNIQSRLECFDEHRHRWHRG